MRMGLSAALAGLAIAGALPALAGTSGYPVKPPRAVSSAPFDYSKRPVKPAPPPVDPRQALAATEDFEHHHYTEALKVLVPLAEGGDALSQFYVGLAYGAGAGVTQDNTVSLEWMHKAAAQNYAPAQCAIGESYEKGRGVTKDLAEAALWYGKSADNNFACGIYNLGRFYENGMGVDKDYARAIALYQKAADQDFDMAQWALGHMYADGSGVTRNDATAAGWYGKAAIQGFAPAQYALGRSYALGLGVKKDFSLAYQWFSWAMYGFGGNDAAAWEQAMKASIGASQNLTKKQVKALDKVIDPHAAEPAYPAPPPIPAGTPAAQ